MKNRTKKIYTWLLVLSFTLQNSTGFTGDQQVVDDKGVKHNFDMTSAQPAGWDFMGRPKIGDTIAHNGETKIVTDIFLRNGSTYFALSPINTPDRVNNLLNPNMPLSANLLQSPVFKRENLDLSKGAPQAKMLSDSFLKYAYINSGGPNRFNSDTMEMLYKAAYNTEKQFLNNYYQKLTIEAQTQIDQTSKELDFPTNSSPGISLPQVSKEAEVKTSPSQSHQSFSPTENDFDAKPYTSDHKVELEGLRNRLYGAPSKDLASYQVKKAAFINLRKADIAFNLKLEESAEIFLKVGKFLVDIATDIIPVTSIPKDTYRVLVGKDPMTGRQLSSFERSLAAGFIIFTVGTLGLGNMVKLVSKEVEILTEATAKEIAAVQKIEKNTETVWDSIKPTQEFYLGTVLPKSFELTLENGTKLWIAPNSTEHIFEFVKSRSNIGISGEQLKLTVQFEMSRLKNVLENITRNGIQFDYLYKLNGWEIIIGTPRVPEGAPAVFHALDTLRGI